MESSKARNQRKADAHAPTHVKSKTLAARLDAELQKVYGKRSARVCVGDTVVILRGDEDIRNIEGKVLSVDANTSRVTIDGITINQADSTAVARPIHASNLRIVKLNLEDPWRKDALMRGKGAKE